jgi:tetratricopeptide (TPR) repeat protein
VAAAVLLVFAPVVTGLFVGPGDSELLLGHDRWHGLDGGRLSWMLETARGGTWQPLAWVSLGLDFAAAGGPDPGALHRTSLVLHALGAGLLVLLCDRVTSLRLSPWNSAVCAALAAAVWALHPLRVEPVAWAAARGDVLACPLLVGAGILWWDALASPALSPWRVAGAVALAALATLASPAALLAPVALLAVAFAVRSAIPESHARSASPLSLVGLAALPALPGVVALSAALDAGAQFGSAPAASLLAFCEGAVRVVRTSLWPFGLHPLVDPPPGLPDAVPGYLWTSALLAGGALVAIAAGLGRGRPGAVVLVSVLALAAGPLLLGRTPFGADRIAHAATVPLAVAAAGALASLPDRPRAAGLVVTGAAAAALAIGARALLPAWHDASSMERRVLQIDPTNEDALARRGEATRRGAGSLDAAVADHRRSLEHDERRPLAHAYLGLALVDLGRREEAEHHLSRAGQLAPWLAPARRGLGVLLLRDGRLDGAVRELEAAAAADGESFATWFALGRARALAGDEDRAAQAFRRALALRPEHVRAREELARLESR